MLVGEAVCLEVPPAVTNTRPSTFSFLLRRHSLTTPRALNTVASGCVSLLLAAAIIASTSHFSSPRQDPARAIPFSNARKGFAIRKIFGALLLKARCRILILRHHRAQPFSSSSLNPNPPRSTPFLKYWCLW